MNENTCVHINSFKSSKGLQLLKFLFTYFISTSSSKARIFKAISHFCHTCNNINHRLHSCLHCIYIGCYQGGHIQEHAKLKKHYLALDLAYGMTLCFQCGDYVYDKEILLMARDYGLKTVKPHGTPSIYSKWKPDRRGLDLLVRNPRRRKIKNSTIGLRGLVNLGNTCYVNSVMQTFTHIPLLRDFFLSDKNHFCQFSSESEKCLFCGFSHLFQEFYSGERSPLVIGQLLHLIWTYEEYFISIEQQDVHEFYIAVLNLLHKHCSANPFDQNCNCIVDQIFTGRIQSEVVCHSCNRISTKETPFWDIGLDLVQLPTDNYTPNLSSTTGSSMNSSLPNASTSSPSTNTNAEVTVSDRVSFSLNENTGKNVKLEPQISLIDCLEQYTRTEHLDENQKLECVNCENNKDSSIQFSLKKLPVVICFQLKRFKITNKVKKKISTFCSFPEHLDMTPFMSHNQNINNHHGPINGLTIGENRYSLFAVINHLGDYVDSGHYTSFIRQHRNNWFLCDDDEIKKSSLEAVLQSEGYLLFYHKQLLEYE